MEERSSDTYDVDGALLASFVVMVVFVAVFTYVYTVGPL